MTSKFQYLHRIDPNMDEAGARRILAHVLSDIPRLTPKARARAEAQVEMIKADIRAIVATTKA